jgi:hypothetical protein
MVILFLPAASFWVFVMPAPLVVSTSCAVKPFRPAEGLDFGWPLVKTIATRMMRQRRKAAAGNVRKTA